MQRLDVALVERGLCESREKAQRAIMAGKVTINQRLARKASETVKVSDAVHLEGGEKYVSRGGYKLEHGLHHFGIDPRGQTCLDVGASTGGFTDCLLQHGAARVYAVDVGRGQLAWKLRQDSRVVVMEETNARELTAARFPPVFRPFQLAVIDCSFISLRKILSPIVALLDVRAKLLALIKPQFEAGKLEADRGQGVIRDPKVHERIISEVHDWVAAHGALQWGGVTPSPLLGPAGNKEFLALIEKTV